MTFENLMLACSLFVISIWITGALFTIAEYIKNKEIKKNDR